MNKTTQPSVRIRYQNLHFSPNAIVKPLPRKEVTLYRLLLSNRTTSYSNPPRIRNQPILHQPLQYEHDRNTRLSKAPRKHHFFIISPTTPNKPLYKKHKTANNHYNHSQRTRITFALIPSREGNTSTYSSSHTSTLHISPFSRFHPPNHHSFTPPLLQPPSSLHIPTPLLTSLPILLITQNHTRSPLPLHLHHKHSFSSLQHSANLRAPPIPKTTLTNRIAQKQRNARTGGNRRTRGHYHKRHFLPSTFSFSRVACSVYLLFFYSVRLFLCPYF